MRSNLGVSDIGFNRPELGEARMSTLGFTALKGENDVYLGYG